MKIKKKILKTKNFKNEKKKIKMKIIIKNKTFQSEIWEWLLVRFHLLSECQQF